MWGRDYISRDVILVQEDLLTWVLLKPRHYWLTVINHYEACGRYTAKVAQQEQLLLASL